MYSEFSFQIIITALKRSLRRLCFHRCLSVHRAGCLPLIPGVYATHAHWADTHPGQTSPLGRPIPWADTPRHTPWADTRYRPWADPWADTPLGRHPTGQTPHWADTPLGRQPPCPVQASHWNAVLLEFLFLIDDQSKISTLPVVCYASKQEFHISISQI